MQVPAGAGNLRPLLEPRAGPDLAGCDTAQNSLRQEQTVQ